MHGKKKKKEEKEKMKKISKALKLILVHSYQEPQIFPWLYIFKFSFLK